VSKIIINPNLQRKQIRQERRNVFAEETNLYLLRLLRGDSALPGTLGFGNTVAGYRDLQLELATAIRQRVLPWFWSITLHIVILLLLLSIVIPVIRFEQIDILSGWANIPVQHDHPILGPLGDDNGNVPNVVDAVDNGATSDDEIARPEVLPVHHSPGLDISGRDPHLRAARQVAGGGGGQTDEAVIAGLRWLVRVQEPNGAWHFSGNFPHRAHRRDREDALAATAMALLAFQGFGITVDSRHPLLIEFVLPVRRAWDWLLPRQNPDGSFHSPLAPRQHTFYTHALCTIALCELLIMTGDESLREPAQRAIDYLVRNQSVRRGGWRYLPDRWSDQSDVSVTGWVVLALKSGEAAGLHVPPETYNRVMGFLDEMMVGDQYKYRYEEPTPRMTMTAQALFCRMLLGWQRDNPQLLGGVRVLLGNLPSMTDHFSRDSYYWFFATQTLYHYGSDEWLTWNTMIREELLRHQERFGAEAGSWNPERPAQDTWQMYGRLYTTCMSLYMLQVYYRHERLFP